MSLTRITTGGRYIDYTESLFIFFEHTKYSSPTGDSICVSCFNGITGSVQCIQYSLFKRNRFYEMFDVCEYDLKRRNNSYFLGVLKKLLS